MVSFSGQARLMAILLCALLGQVLPARAGELTITVNSSARQVFQGFGGSEAFFYGSEKAMWDGMSEQSKQSLVQRMYGRDGGADFRIVRLWLNGDAGAMASYYGDFINHAKAVQPDLVVLLAPSCGNHGDLCGFGQGIAGTIRGLKDHGIDINVTGICNEPDDGNRLVPSDAPQIIKCLRSALDGNGCEEVKIIAPEDATVDTEYYEFIDAIKSDPEALSALYGWASHSYNCAITDTATEIIAGTGVPTYWVTEASVDRPAGDNDDDVATITGTTILADMNMAVTHWIYFMGASGMHGTSLIAMQGSGYTVTLQYVYMEQIAKAFDVGCRMRFCLSDKHLPRPEMTWEFWQKPAVSAACAFNPDGTVAIGAINCTGVRDDGNNSISTYYDAERYDVSFIVEDLANTGPLDFTVWISNGSKRIEEQGEKMTVNDGRFDLTLDPKNLYCLRSVEPVAAARPRARAAVGTATRLEVTGSGMGAAGPLVRFDVPPDAGRTPLCLNLDVYDARGARVGRFVDNGFPARTWRMPIEEVRAGHGRLPQGVYLVRLKAGGFVGTARAIFRQ